MKCKFLSAMFVLFLSGVSTAVADLTDNPAEIYFLGLSSPAVKSLSEEMLATARVISEQNESYFDTDTSVCPLKQDMDAYYAIIGMDASKMRELDQAMEKQWGTITQRSLEWVKLSEGQCKNGLPEGDFVVTFKAHDRTTFSNNAKVLDHTNFYRIKGKMVDGKREGFGIGEGLMINNNSPDSPYGRFPIVYAEVFKNGVKEGVNITIAGPNVMVNREVDTSYGRKRFVKMYDGNGTLLGESQMVNNLTHGEQLTFMGGKEIRSCWHYGQMVKSLRECEAYKLPPSLLAKLSAQQVDGLAIFNNSGTYISPYTTDGTLAEWVNAVLIIDMGASIGTVVGSVGGAAAAGMLDFIPYGLGGLLASAIGGHFGKKIGKAQGLEAAGGMDKLRSDSDLSFASMNDMALYLSAKHGSDVTFSDAIRATSVIYPDLPKAIARLK